MDHIDRNIENNHVSNLQILSKNEHFEKTIRDQGLNIREKKFCKECGCEIDYSATFCKLHYVYIDNSEISKSSIEDKVSKMGWSKAGRYFNISDNGLRKRYKRLGGNVKTLMRKR